MNTVSGSNGAAIRRMLLRMSVPLGLMFCTSSLSSKIVVLNDDGAWNWFQDERVIVAGDKLVVASVASGARDPRRKGAIEVAAYDLKTGETQRATLHHEPASLGSKMGWLDDHNCPPLVLRPGGKIVAMYSEKDRNEKVYYRISASDRDFTAWESERVFLLPAGSVSTFINLFYLPRDNGGAGRMLSFFRGMAGRGMPSWAYSDDSGETWTAGNVYMDFPKTHVPYVKFASDGRDTIHLAFSDGHRWAYGNAMHHVFYRNGHLYGSDGKLIRNIREGLTGGATDATLIFRANAQSVVSATDLALDSKGYPRVVYSLQPDSALLQPMPIGLEHRYRYARWTGTKWIDGELAHAGREVHPVGKGDDCTGLVALDPQDENVLYISTDADPVRGTPLISQTDGKRHWEIFRGRTSDGGALWAWTPITRDSDRDNIRPIVPEKAPKGQTVVVWLRGRMHLPTDYDMEVVGLVPETR